VAGPLTQKLDIKSFFVRTTNIVFAHYFVSFVQKWF